MALALRPLLRRHLLRLALLSTSAAPPDPRELLRIERILHAPAADATQPREPLEHSRSAPAATTSSSSLQQILHRAAGLTTAESTSLLRRFPGPHIHHLLGRLLHELAGLRIPGGEIKAVLASDPEGILAMDPGEPSRLLEFLGELRCRKAVKDQVLARGALRAAVAARCRVELLHARGLTRREALRVLTAEPRAMLYPLEDVERKVDFLVNTMGVQSLLAGPVPEFLLVNLEVLENWIIPQHNMVEHLRSIGGLGDPIDTKHWVGHGEEGRDETVRRRHPTGWWKLFTPVKHERTEEDVENMKLVVESLR